jgi:hypothetical protein
MLQREYKNLVNFKHNLILPRHRWFNIKEGYSAKLVQEIFKETGIKKEDIVLDPFSGSGTTILESSVMGVKSIGIEVNPFLFYLSNIKSKKKAASFDEVFKSFSKNLTSKKSKLPILSISEKLFGKQINDVLRAKNAIDMEENIFFKDLLKISFLCSLDACSTAKKDGNGLKYPKSKKVKDFMNQFETNLNMVINDMHDLEIKRIPKLMNGNSLEIINSTRFKKKYSSKISLVLFSPPYANCFDYTEVYKTELWFGDFVKDYSDMKVLRNQSMSSHLNKELKDIELIEIEKFIKKLNQKKLWSKKITPMLINYFSEMKLLLADIHYVLKKGGKCVIVIGNSAYGNIVIPTDEIFSNMAKNIGYRSAKIKVARKLGTSSQQYNKVDNPHLLRESLVYLKK